MPDYPKDPEFIKKFGPRGVIHSFADGRIEDTGPLTKKRMETIDDDVAARSAEFIEKQHKAGKPFFVWVNFTHMHFRTHAKPESVGQAGRWQGIYHDVMIDHDKNVGTVLDKLDELGIADNTIVMYGTDNGPHMNTWPDAAMTPFRNEKNSNWEGAYRVPAMVRWPGKIKPGSVSNDIMSHLDWMPTLLAAAGDPDIKEKLIEGLQGGRQEVQGPPRRLQLPALPDGPGEEGPPGGVLLLLRRRRSDGAALRQLEGGLRPAESAGHHVGLERAAMSTHGFRGCSICARIPTSGRASPRTPTGTGGWTMPSCWCRHRHTSASSWRHSRSSRRARRRPASRSTRSWNSCRTPGPPIRLFQKASRTKDRSTLKAGRTF